VTNHLLRDHDDRLDGELAVAVVKEVLQARAQQVNDEDVVKALLAEVVYIGDTGCTLSVVFGSG
jgi:ABC-type transporter Mla MlaB component